MSTAFSLAFLVSLAGMLALGIYGLYCFIKEMISERAWGFLAFVACLLIFIGANIALHFLGVLPEPAP